MCDHGLSRFSVIVTPITLGVLCCVVLCPVQELQAEKEQMETKHDDELQELKERHGQEFHDLGEGSQCSLAG